MNKELQIILAKYFTIVALTIIYIVFMVTLIGPAINHAVYGQEVKAPAPITPTPVPTPTPTSPNPNLQYLPQKAYVQAYAPENGIPATSGQLQVVPQVVPAAPQQAQASIIDQLGGVTGLLAMAGAAGVYVKAHLIGKKTEKVEETTREQSEQIVKGAKVDKTIADQVYENMADKGNSITDKPEIKLENLNKNIDEAVKTASKA